MSHKVPFKQPPPPKAFPFGLRYVALFFPYRLQSMMNLAWMSDDFRAKKVGCTWLFSDKATQDSMDLEDQCEKAHITPAEFIGVVAGVAYELRVDVSGVIGGIMRMPQALLASLTRAVGTGNIDEAVAAIEYINKSVRRR